MQWRTNRGQGFSESLRPLANHEQCFAMKRDALSEAVGFFMSRHIRFLIKSTRGI